MADVSHDRGKGHGRMGQRGDRPTERTIAGSCRSSRWA